MEKFWQDFCYRDVIKFFNYTKKEHLSYLRTVGYEINITY